MLPITSNEPVTITLPLTSNPANVGATLLFIAMPPILKSPCNNDDVLIFACLTIN